MLVDVKPKPDPEMNLVLSAIARMAGNSDDMIRHAAGVYETGGFNFEHTLGLSNFDDKYPNLTRRKRVVEEGGVAEDEPDYINCYGVCDSWQQVIEACVELDPTNAVAYCMAITPIVKAHQPEQGGWRWHKWGPYIGTQKREGFEYIHDEPHIELVYVYHIYKIPEALIDRSGQYEQKAIKA